MAMTSQNQSYALDEVVSAAAFESLMTGPMYTPTLFGIQQGTGFRDRFAAFGSLGRLQPKTASQAGAQDNMRQHFYKDFTHQAYGKTIEMEREARDDNRWGLSQRLGVAFGEAVQYTMEVDGAELFSGAFTTVLSQDGLTLCNTAHLNGSGGNSQSNRGTSALSMATVRSTREAMKRFKNLDGNVQGASPDELIVPPELEEDAWAIIRSTGRPDSPNRAENMYFGMFSLYVLDKMGSDANDWFMCDSIRRKRNLLWLSRVSPEFFTSLDQFTGNQKFGCYTRYSFGPLNWDWVYGHIVA